MEKNTTITLGEHQKATGKTWARIAAELTECAMSRDPDRLNRIFEGRLWRLLSGVRAYEWESQALVDLCGEGTVYK